MKLFYSVKNYLFDALTMFKTQGLRKTWKRFGWKLVAGIFAYYIVRDTLLYLVIPSLILSM